MDSASSMVLTSWISHNISDFEADNYVRATLCTFRQHLKIPDHIGRTLFFFDGVFSDCTPHSTALTGSLPYDDRYSCYTTSQSIRITHRAGKIMIFTVLPVVVL